MAARFSVAGGASSGALFWSCGVAIRNKSIGPEGPPTNHRPCH
ncbi:DUF6053 domain-containing protein [Lysobacter enzymogenes]